MGSAHCERVGFTMLVGGAHPTRRLRMAFLIDDLLLFPLKAIVANVKKAAEEDLHNEKKEIMASLSGLHQRLESGEIDEKQFDEQETKWLDRLETIENILHPEPPLTNIERLQKHFPEEFKPEPKGKAEPENEPPIEDELESIRQDYRDLVMETESTSRVGFASLRDKSGAIRPRGIEPVSMEGKASGLEPTKLEPVGLGSAKRGLGSKPPAAAKPKEP